MPKNDKPRKGYKLYPSWELRFKDWDSLDNAIRQRKDYLTTQGNLIGKYLRYKARTRQPIFIAKTFKKKR